MTFDPSPALLTYYERARFEYLAAREKKEECRRPVPAPACVIRDADLIAAMDDTAGFSATKDWSKK